jgi:CHRD domain/PEP-CTERM motif
MKRALPIMLFAAVLAPSMAHATIETFNAILDGAQVAPGAGGPTGSTAMGNATIVFDSSARTITTDLSWTGLTGPTDRSHIHDGTPGNVSNEDFFHEILFNSNSVSNSGSPLVDCWLGPDACRDTTGFVEDVFQMPLPGDPDCLVYDNCDFTDLLNRAENLGLYIDIHTEQFPEGEIRGALRPAAVPEPSTWLLFGSSLAGLACWRRKRA